MPESRNAKSRASSYRKAFGSMANYSTAGSRGLGIGHSKSLSIKDVRARGTIIFGEKKWYVHPVP